MRNLDFGFDVITRRERDHECHDWTTQDAALFYVMGRLIKCRKLCLNRGKLQLHHLYYLTPERIFHVNN